MKLAETARRFTFPALMAALCVLAYALLIGQTGFFWDDWVFAWIARFMGPAELIPAFLPFRPLLGPIFAVTTTIFGTDPLIWQIVGVLVRFASGMAMWWTLCQIWPPAKLQTALTALFFVVFPGYMSQWVALTHVNQELIPLICFTLSLGFTASAVRGPGRRSGSRWAALLLAMPGVWSTEYFFGLELLRPIVMGIVFAELGHAGKERWLSALRAWLPYLLLWIGDAAFIYIYHSSTAYQSYDLSLVGFATAAPLTVILQSIQDWLLAIGTAGFASWISPFQILARPFTGGWTWAAITAAALTYVLVLMYARKVETASKASAGLAAFAPGAIVLGLVGIVAGRIPSWAAGLPYRLEFSADRFSLSTMLGASLLVIGLVDWLVSERSRKIALAGVLIAFATSWQFTNALAFRDEWLMQQRFFQQLVWRAPSLEPGTLVLTDELPLVYVTDMSMTAPLNWIYASQFKGRELPYLMAYTTAHLGAPRLPALQPGLPVTAAFRTTQFNSNTDSILAVYWNPKGCVRVLDPVYENASVLPGVNHTLIDAIPLSKVSRINPDALPPEMPQALFGAEPARDWCYYFEKAGLARQQGNWAEVARLADEVLKAGYRAQVRVEWLVFAEGYAHQGRIADAAALTKSVLGGAADMKPAVCAMWRRSGVVRPECTP